MSDMSSRPSHDRIDISRDSSNGNALYSAQVDMLSNARDLNEYSLASSVVPNELPRISEENTLRPLLMSSNFMRSQLMSLEPSLCHAVPASPLRRHLSISAATQIRRSFASESEPSQSLSGPCDPRPSLISSVVYSSVSITPSNKPELFCCPHCGKEFTNKYRRGNYRRHRRLKHGSALGHEEREYPCEACDKVFQRQDARLEHQRKWHPALAMAAPVIRRYHLWMT